MKEAFRTEEFTCMRDGLTIRGTRYIPAEDGRYPIAVLCHGLMQSRNSMRRYAQELSGRGFAAYVFDFNGGGSHGTSDGRTTDMSVLTEVRDLKAVIAHAKGDRDIWPDRLILMGASQGGLVAALAAAELQEKVKGLILFYPAFCIPDYVREGDIRFGRFDPEHLPKTLNCGAMKLGRIYMSDLMNMNAMEEISKYHGPALLVHGEADELVDYSYSKRAFTVYQKDSTQPRTDLELFLIPGAGHDFRDEAESLAIRAMRRFLSRRVQILAVDAYYTDIDSRREKIFNREEWMDYGGSCETPFFSGNLEPSQSYAEQFVRFRKIRVRQDCFVLSGKDYQGKDCQLRLLLSYDGQKYSLTSLTTDSESLSFLQEAGCSIEVLNRPEGPRVYLYAKRKEVKLAFS